MNAATDIALNEENVNRVIEAIRGLFESYTGQMNAAIRDNKDRKLTVNLSVCIAHTNPAPLIDVKIAFVPCKVTDLMSLVCVDPAQKQFKFENEDQAAPEPDEQPHVVAETITSGGATITMGQAVELKKTIEEANARMQVKRGRKARPYAVKMEGGEA